MPLPNAGARLIIASDGVWDAVTPEMAVDCCRGMPPDCAAERIVQVLATDFEGKVEFVEAFPLSNQDNILNVEGLALKRGMELAMERNLSKNTAGSKRQTAKDIELEVSTDRAQLLAMLVQILGEQRCIKLGSSQLHK